MNSELAYINPEKLAYWYLRLNGFFQIENFYVHPAGAGGARTDVDLLAVRFPHRQERRFERSGSVMKDDDQGLGLSLDYIDVVMAEVKMGRCALNGPWTSPCRANMERVLAAVGCLADDKLGPAANGLYDAGYYEQPAGSVRVRLVALGREECAITSMKMPKVTQVTWDHALGFIHQRFRQYRNQKRQTEAWDPVGLFLKRLATERSMNDVAEFIRIVMDRVNAWAEHNGQRRPSP